MGAGASTLANASADEVKAAVSSLPKESSSKLSEALELLSGRPRGIQQMCSQQPTAHFDAAKAVPKKVVVDIVDALRSVPSSANTQPWTIVVLEGSSKAQLSTKLLAKFDANDAGTTEYADLPSTMIPRMEKAVAEYKKDENAHLEATKSALATAPLHVLVMAPTGPCLKEDPPVDGVYLDMGSAMTAISMCAHDLGLGVHCDFSVAKHGEVCREVLGSDFPEEHFVVCGLSLGWPSASGCASGRLPVDETTRWINCDSAWLSAPATPVASPHGLMHLVSSRHCSHTLDTNKVVPKDLISEVLAAARWVQSMSNSQPWAVTVVQGQARDTLSKAMLDYFDAGNNGGQSYKKYSTQNTARMQKGKDQYGFELYEQRHGLQRDDAEGRRAKYRPNYEFWGAPVLLLLNLPKSAVAGTFVDVGSYMYGILVAMHAYGLGGKPLGSVAKFTDLCREVLGEAAMPADEHLVCGICIGWPQGGRDPRETPDWFPSRLATDETVRFVSSNDWA